MFKCLRLSKYRYQSQSQRQQIFFNINITGNKVKDNQLKKCYIHKTLFQITACKFVKRFDIYIVHFYFILTNS